MHEYFVWETHESIGFAYAQGKCKLTRMGHKHEPHIDGDRACPGHTAQALFTIERAELSRVTPIPFPPVIDPDDQIRSAFN